MIVLPVLHGFGGVGVKDDASILESVGPAKVADFECTRFGIKPYCDENKPVSLQNMI